jgi:hypothetical protein
LKEEDEDAKDEEEENTGNRTTENKETSSKIGEMITSNTRLYMHTSMFH